MQFFLFKRLNVWCKGKRASLLLLASSQAVILSPPTRPPSRPAWPGWRCVSPSRWRTWTPSRLKSRRSSTWTSSRIAPAAASADGSPCCSLNSGRSGYGELDQQRKEGFYSTRNTFCTYKWHTKFSMFDHYYLDKQQNCNAAQFKLTDTVFSLISVFIYLKCRPD